MSSDNGSFVYSKAVVCGGVASTLPASSLRLGNSKGKVDLEKARQQQREYVEVSSLMWVGWRLSFLRGMLFGLLNQIFCVGFAEVGEGGAHDSCR